MERRSHASSSSGDDARTKRWTSEGVAGWGAGRGGLGAVVVILMAMPGATEPAFASWFGTPVEVPLPGQVSDMAAGELDGAPGIDVAICSLFSDQVWVYLNDGAGGFTLVSTLPSPGASEFVTISDFNGDGFDDIVASDYNTGAGPVIYYGLGGGAFQSAILMNLPATSARLLASCDLDSDGYAELIVPYRAQIDIYWGSSAGPSIPPTELAFELNNCWSSTAVRDLEIVDSVGDGGLDLVILVQDGECDGPMLRGLGRFVWLGGRSYAPVEWLRMEQYTTWWGDWPSFDSGDVDGDADVDFVVAEPKSLLPLIKTGPGIWSDGPETDLNCYDAVLSDLNGDDLVDMVGVGNCILGSPSSIHRGLGDGTFELVDSCSPFFQRSQCLDLDGDADTDVVGVDETEDALVTWFNELASATAPQAVATVPIELHPTVVHAGEFVRMRLDPAHGTSTGSRALRIFDATGRVVETVRIARQESETSWQVPTWFPAGRVWVGISTRSGSVPLTILR